VNDAAIRVYEGVGFMHRRSLQLAVIRANRSNLGWSSF